VIWPFHFSQGVGLTVGGVVIGIGLIQSTVKLVKDA